MRVDDLMDTRGTSEAKYTWAFEIRACLRYKSADPEMIQIERSMGVESESLSFSKLS